MNIGMNLWLRVMQVAPWMSTVRSPNSSIVVRSEREGIQLRIERAGPLCAPRFLVGGKICFSMAAGSGVVMPDQGGR